jgi:two-component system cell cycle response regulator DivK
VQAGVPTQDHDPARSATKRILIVEDDALNRQLLHDLLQAHGYDVTAAGEAAAALALVRSKRPDLILLDLQLPDLSGYEVARRLKREAATRWIPVVAVTGFALEGDERKALASGCDGYVAKPIRLRPFLDTVAGFLCAPPANG